MANQEKNRKSEAQEKFEEADNAGRFAGAQEAKNRALQQGATDTTGYHSGTVVNESGDRAEPGDEFTNASAHRGDAQVQEFSGDADNVDDNGSRPLSDEELEHARNKANQGSR
jgi:hypothetical protein